MPQLPQFPIIIVPPAIKQLKSAQPLVSASTELLPQKPGLKIQGVLAIPILGQLLHRWQLAEYHKKLEEYNRRQHQ